ncbi:unnamed protein product, partial [Prorocentrum cordatum]
MDAGWAPAAAEVSPQHRPDKLEWGANVVTVMMRQIPRHITQQHLLQEVIAHGFEGLFDFLYPPTPPRAPAAFCAGRSQAVASPGAGQRREAQGPDAHWPCYCVVADLPWDLKKGTNVGYGFISFSDPRTAASFRDAFDGTYLGTPEARTLTGFSEKPVKVHPASTQGYQANYQHFVNTKTGQKQDPLYSPLFFPGNGPNTLSRLLHTVCAGDGAPPKQAGPHGGTRPSFQAALAEGLPNDAPAAGQLQLGGREALALPEHGSGRTERQFYSMPYLRIQGLQSRLTPAIPDASCSPCALGAWVTSEPKKLNSASELARA